jgi:6,7-dimethyl-8-ribityllumazine synthase
MQGFGIKQLTGQLNGQGLRIGLVASRFNEVVTKSLVSGAIDALSRHGVDQEDMRLAWVPGAFEIPLLAKKMAESGAFDAVICLGTVIRGATPHFDYVAGQAASGVANIALATGIPVIFGVLTTNTFEEAMERAGAKAGNKGFDCALAAIEMAHLVRQFDDSKREVESLNS